MGKNKVIVVAVMEAGMWQSEVARRYGSRDEGSMNSCAVMPAVAALPLGAKVQTGTVVGF